MWFLHIGSAYPLLGQRMANTVGYEGAIGGVIHMLKLAPAATPVMAAGRRRMMRPSVHQLAIGTHKIARRDPKSVASGQSDSVRGYSGGRRVIKKKHMLPQITHRRPH